MKREKEQYAEEFAFNAGAAILLSAGEYLRQPLLAFREERKVRAPQGRALDNVQWV
jgi:hypothetical protein